METVLFSTYIMSNIDTHLDKKDVVNMQQTCNSIYNSLNYKKCIVRREVTELQFKQHFINYVLDAQEKKNPENLYKIYTHCIKYQYQACIFFRNEPEIFTKLMSRLDRMEGSRKYNQGMVIFLSDMIPKIYCNFI